MTTELTQYYDFKAIDRADLADGTKVQYKKALRNYLNTGAALWDADALADYAAAQGTSTRAFLKAAIHLVLDGDERQLKAGASPDNLPMVQAALLRIDALHDAIQVRAPKGEKAHTWLSQAEVKQLMATCDDSLVGRRDWLVLALLVGAGLRREEVTQVDCTALVSMPTKKGMRLCLSVLGKGSKQRTIPVHPMLASRLQAWCAEISGGQLARSLGRKQELGQTLSAVGVFDIVRKHGAMIGKDGLDPHDLRRTYAQLGYAAGVPITQISKLLGHSSVKTTQAYLNMDLDLETTASDFIPLE